LVAATVGKVTNRVRQIVAARVGALKAGMPAEQIGPLEETLIKERDGMRALFGLIVDAVTSYANGSADAFIEGADGLTDDDLDAIKSWGRRWATTFQRKAAVEEAVVGEAAVAATLANAQIDFVREEARRKAEKLKEQEEQRKRDEERQKRLAAELAEAEKAEKAANGGGANGGVELDVADMDEAH
jgi:nuclear cap-binding protein subunit 1